MKLNKEISEICGVHAGDGYLRIKRKSKEIDITGSKEEKDYYDNHVIPLFNKVFNLNIKGKFYSKGTYGFVKSSKKMGDVLNSFGFPCGKKSLNVKIPEQILKSNDKKIMGGFLRGLFDTDSCIYF